MSAEKSLFDYRMTRYHEAEQWYLTAKATEPAITRTMQNAAARIGCSMSGLEYSVKEASHVEEKIETRLMEARSLKESATVDDVLKDINDLVRYTYICEHEQIANATNNAIAALRQEGYQCYLLKNRYAEPHRTTGYKDILIGFVSPYGQTCELQIHSAISLAVKDEGHEAYKILSNNRDPARREELIQHVREVHSKNPDPPGIHKIAGFEKDIEEVRQGMWLDQVFIKREMQGTTDVIHSQIVSLGKLIEDRQEKHYKDGSVSIEEQYIDKGTVVKEHIHVNTDRHVTKTVDDPRIQEQPVRSVDTWLSEAEYTLHGTARPEIDRSEISDDKEHDQGIDRD